MRLQYEIGKGAFGQVFQANNKSDSSIKVAIKTIKKEGLDAYGKLLIEREIQLLNQLDHPNIVRYYETYEDEFYLYLVMELCTGGELYQTFLENKSNMTESYVSRQMFKLLKAL